MSCASSRHGLFSGSDAAPKLKGLDKYCLHRFDNYCPAQDRNRKQYTQASCEADYGMWNPQGNCCYTDVQCDIMDPAKCTAQGGVVDGCDGAFKGRN